MLPLSQITALLLLLRVKAILAPMLNKRYRFTPFNFVFPSCVLLSLLLWLFVNIFASKVMPMYVESHNATHAQYSSVTLHVDSTSFYKANINLTNINALALLCMVVYFVCQCMRGWPVYIVPLLREVAKLERTLWHDALDLRGRSIPMQSNADM